MRMVRIHVGGGAFFFGSLKRLAPYDVFFVRLRIMNMTMIVTEKPNKGDISRDNPMSCAFDQFTAASVAPGRSEYAIPTPRMDPISVCELEHGMPKYHVKRFQKIALISRAITMDKLWVMFWSTSDSTGNRFTMPMATPIPPSQTPMKLQIPERTTAAQGLSELV